MKLSEYRNEQALELIADIIEPIARLFADSSLVRALQNGQVSKAIQISLKQHQKDVIEVLARVQGVSVKDYDANVIVMTKQLLEILNDEELVSFFSSQGVTDLQTPSGSVTEITKGKRK